MNTSLTVADVIAQLANLGKTRAQLLPILNEVVEWYINSGKWRGSVIEVDFDSAAGYISLPWEVSGILCSTYDRVPVLAYSQYHSYIINGPGEFDEAKKWGGRLEDMGDGWATQGNIESASTLRIKTHEDDDDKIIRIYGTLDGRVVYDEDGIEGISYTCQAPFIDTTEQFDAVTGIEASPDPTVLMVRPWTLHVNDGDDTRIGQYYPGENRPMYRRYKTGQVDDKRIRVLCQRRFRLLRNDADWVPIGNINALRSGVWAKDFENASDIANRDNAFNQGLQALNSEAKSSRGGTIPDSSFVNWTNMGGCGGAYGGWGVYGGGTGMVTM